MTEKKLQNLPIGIQNFETLRRGNYLYVDKTKDIYELARPTSPAYFLSRPRRFGKSLLCSTLKALFEGKKELFSDTWIATSDWEWKKHPIIYLSMDNIGHSTPQIFRTKLQETLASIAKTYKVSIKQDTPGDMLKNLIIELEQKHGPVVMLIDEYDKPLINNLENPPLLEEFRAIMRELYEYLKPSGAFMRFLFITGVSKFSKVSIFSTPNHLNELSDKRQAATICGYTQAELEYSFADSIDKAAQRQNCSRDEMLAEIKRWYNGYCFLHPDDSPGSVYNPFSIINFFEQVQLNVVRFKNYWFESGTPSFVIKYFKANDFTMADFERAQATSRQIGNITPDSLDLRTVLYQTGYLTIKDIEPTTGNFILNFPNEEVKRSCLEELMNFMSGNKANSFVRKFALEFSKLFVDNNVSTQTIMTALIRICAQIPSTIAPRQEQGYQFIFWIIFEMMDINIYVEDPTALGRIDVTILREKIAYVIELKIKGAVAEAMNQIEYTNYADKYIAQGKEVVKIGIVFDVKVRTVTEISLLDTGAKKPITMKNPLLKKPVIKKKIAQKPVKKISVPKKKVAKK